MRSVAVGGIVISVVPVTLIAVLDVIVAVMLNVVPERLGRMSSALRV